MRNVALAVALLVLVVPASAAVTPEIDPRASLSVVQQWIYNYRAKPDYAHVPAAVRVLFHSQTFKEPENAGIYLGFIAGAIGSNPAKAEQLVNSFFPIPLEETKPGMMDKLKGVFTKNPFGKDVKKLNTAVTFAGNQDLLDTLWGYYFATGSHLPILKIMQMLPWSKSRDTLDKLTVGSMARYTLASYAVRDANL